MPPNPPGPRIDDTGLWLPPGLHLSFQRHAAPADGGVQEPVPRSLGLLPLAPSPDGGLLLPLAEGEAFWIGLEAGAALRLELVVVAKDGSRERLAREVAGPGRIAGFAGRAFTSAAVESVQFATDAAAASVRVVSYAQFTAATGRAAPPALDPRAGFGGWRLP